MCALMLAQGRVRFEGPLQSFGRGGNRVGALETDQSQRLRDREEGGPVAITAGNCCSSA